MTKSTFLHFLTLCAAALAITRHAKPSEQKSLVSVDIMAEQDKVRGHNDAIYGPIPKEDQLLDVEFLEIAPTPIIADRVFFVYLRGYMPESKKKELGLLDEGLANATLTVSSSVVYLDGNSEDSESVTVRFKTTSFNDYAHLVIRDACGAQVDYLPSSGRSDVLLDFQIPTMFLKSASRPQDRLVRGLGSTCVEKVPALFFGGLVGQKEILEEEDLSERKGIEYSMDILESRVCAHRAFSRHFQAARPRF
ncbi:hypothetical protein G7Y89_g15732 [Cudoniella acicularis]|uniref:Uncharacterized protein n=1 Tax=Cudoniella acicularis TaxID=354080 RepID=A0A8H4QHB3_9HELO|nr:hypothetical protein G7Y89_g15732 [Cudoniella acicularis]